MIQLFDKRIALLLANFLKEKGFIPFKANLDVCIDFMLNVTFCTIFSFGTEDVRSKLNAFWGSPSAVHGYSHRGCGSTFASVLLQAL